MKLVAIYIGRSNKAIETLKDGSSLIIENYDRRGFPIFQFADGTYSYYKSAGIWNEKK